MPVKVVTSLLAAGLVLGSGLASAAAPSNMWDVLIRNGQVVDGSGALGYKADVGIKNGVIGFIGNGAGLKAKKVVDASGLIVAPGFIDSHSHADNAAASFKHRQNLADTSQGVTTAVFGPDGSYSPSQIRERKSAFVKNGLGTNYSFYVGHNGIRNQVLGDDYKRQARPDEINRMRALVREGMQDGAVGLSTGLMYDPGIFSSTAEVVALAKEVAPFEGVYDTHVRDPADNLIASDKEAIEIGRAAGIPVKIAHEKAVGPANKGRGPELVALINAQRSGGHDVVVDQYPYDAAGVEKLSTIFVVPGASGPYKIDQIRTALTNNREAVKKATENGNDGGFSWVKAVGWSLRIVDSPQTPELLGKFIDGIAKERGVTSFDVAAELIGKYDDVRITLGSIEEDAIQALLVQPWTMIATDGFATDAAGDPTGTLCRNHPRSTGTYPRVLARYVREQGLLSLPEAIRKMTSFPAQFLGLTDRGLVQRGKAADLAIFDPRTVADLSTYARPCTLSTGMKHVFVNGVAVIEDGRPTEARPGRFVPRQRASRQR